MVIDVASCIKTIRERKKLTQADVAEKLGMERSNYSRLEKRGNDLSVNQIIDIANALGVPPIDLVFPYEAEGMKKGGETADRLHGVIQVLQERNDYLIENQRKIEVFMGFIMQMAKGFEGFGITEEIFKKQLDPEGKLEVWAKSKASDMIRDLQDLNSRDKDEY